MIKTAIKASDFLSSFSHLINGEYLDGQKKTKLDLFVLNLNANEFDYETFKDRLVNPVIDFALSRKSKRQYKTEPATQSKMAREKFKQNMNTGELGEFLLFCFLETHLNAPKILTKLELKTSTSVYGHGSDGVHFLELAEGGYHLIFGESKTQKRLSTSISNAIKSIYEFKKCVNSKGNKKSGLPYEKSLISTEILKETFSGKERAFIKDLIYPKSENNFNVDTAFGLFLGYQISITEKDRSLSNDDCRRKLHTKIEKHIRKAFKTISKKIKDSGLTGHHFYIYILPFSDLVKSRQEIIEHITA